MFVNLLFHVEQYYSYKKVNLLTNQKNIISKISKSQEDSNLIDFIDFNSKIAQIYSEIEKLQNQNIYNYISKFILDNNIEYNDDLNKLNQLVKNFEIASKNYFELNSNDKTMNKLKNDTKLAAILVSSQIDSILIKNISYNKNRFNISNIIFILILIILLTVTIWYRKRLINIYDDILFLYSFGGNKRNTKIFSQEADAIFLRMKRKIHISDNPSMIDPVTEIHNNKGMFQA